jgi:hypothetical protein
MRLNRRMNPSRHIDVQLTLTAGQILNFYRGNAETVVARSLDGRTVHFPAAVLPRLVTPEGVNGIFRLTFDEDNRLADIVPV